MKKDEDVYFTGTQERLTEADADLPLLVTYQQTHDEKFSFTMPRQATPKRKVDAKKHQKAHQKGEVGNNDQQDPPAGEADTKDQDLSTHLRKSREGTMLEAQLGGR